MRAAKIPHDRLRGQAFLSQEVTGSCFRVVKHGGDRRGL